MCTKYIGTSGHKQVVKIQESLITKFLYGKPKKLFLSKQWSLLSKRKEMKTSREDLIKRGSIKDHF